MMYKTEQRQVEIFYPTTRLIHNECKTLKPRPVGMSNAREALSI